MSLLLALIGGAQTAGEPLPLLTPPARPAIEVEAEYWRFNHQVYFQIAQPQTPAAPVSLPLPLLIPKPLPWTLFQDTFAGVYSAQEALQQAIPQGQYLWRQTPPWQEPDTIYAESRRDFTAPLMFWKATPSAQNTPWNLLFQTSYRLADVEADYPRTNAQTLFQFIQPPAAVPVVPPIVAGGSLLPGELGQGMGPYKRPGQVFGEPDPVSPYLTSRAPELPRGQIQLPLATTEEEPGVHYHIELMALVALDELCGSPTDLVRGPLHIIIRNR